MQSINHLTYNHSVPCLIDIFYELGGNWRISNALKELDTFLSFKIFKSSVFFDKLLLFLCQFDVLQRNNLAIIVLMLLRWYFRNIGFALSECIFRNFIKSDSSSWWSSHVLLVCKESPGLSFSDFIVILLEIFLASLTWSALCGSLFLLLFTSLHDLSDIDLWRQSVTHDTTFYRMRIELCRSKGNLSLCSCESRWRVKHLYNGCLQTQDVATQGTYNKVTLFS
jgi:hypothetical protein